MNKDYITYRAFSSEGYSYWEYLVSFDKTFYQGDEMSVVLPIDLSGKTIEIFSNEDFKALSIDGITGTTLTLSAAQTAYLVPGIQSIQIIDTNKIYQYLLGECLKQH
jgi:hypothetical protein